jgi:hypothetical protein
MRIRAVSNIPGYRSGRVKDVADSSRVRALIAAGWLVEVGGAPEAEEDREATGPGAITLAGGFCSLDRRLDRVPEFDERSREFPMREILDAPGAFAGGVTLTSAPKQYKPRSYTWAVEASFDQGSEGSCVGYGWGHELVARPVVVPGVDREFCRWIYRTAKKYDAWAGENYEGTSVLAGAKVIQSRPPKMPEGRGLMSEYRWIFGDMDELVRTLGYFGPVVTGTWWTQGMFEPDQDNVIHPTGAKAGGHCYLLTGVNLRTQRFRLLNSWGTSWGDGGSAWIGIKDFRQLVLDEGELCVPVRRSQWAPP